jgi:Sulfotransferase family
MAMSSVGVGWPEFIIIGAPKAGSSALHAALAVHPQLRLSSPKEPKYFICGDAPPPLYTGPGDAHSRREWIWRRDEYNGLFRGAPPGILTGESTPFYLFDLEAQRRIAETIPSVKLIAVLRDPVDRAYSNWMHLWADGLEPEADVVTACDAEEDRVRGGWAPFWRYRELGRYGRQLESLYGQFPGDQILVLRYRDLVNDPTATLARVCAFLGVDDDTVDSVPRDNTRPFVSPGPRRFVVSQMIRAGAGAGAFFRPQLWRRTSRPLLRLLHIGQPPSRPTLSPEQRAEILEPILPDIDLLEKVTGEDFSDWRSLSSGGSFTSRTASA